MNRVVTLVAVVLVLSLSSAARAEQGLEAAVAQASLKFDLGEVGKPGVAGAFGQLQGAAGVDADNKAAGSGDPARIGRPSSGLAGKVPSPSKPKSKGKSLWSKIGGMIKSALKQIDDGDVMALAMAGTVIAATGCALLVSSLFGVTTALSALGVIGGGVAAFGLSVVVGALGAWARHEKS